MSKFLYVNYRNVNAGITEELLKKINLLFGVKKDEIHYTRKDTVHLLIIKEASNVKVNGKLDFRINLPSSKGDSHYLRVQHEVDCIEVKGDKVGSRAIWYYADTEKLIVSSSQKAIVAVIGSFQPDESAWTWMLANGSLGPELSWDKRIKALPADAKLLFDTQVWKPQVILPNWKFVYEKKSKLELKEELGNLLEEVKYDFDLGETKTLLTLSGGYDSRAALYLLKQNKNIDTATWGIPAAFKTPLTDATVARAVSKAWDTRHFEYDVQLKNNFEQNLEIFLAYGEGRNDHINTFMDGLEMWQRIAEDGYKWVVRADEAFGWLPVKTELDVRTSVAMADFSDFRNVPKAVIESLPKQAVPDYLKRGINEPLEDYRDRLYQQYRLPFVIGPLQDPPLSFVEYLNPLLHPKLIDFARALPPELRTKKKLYAEWVDSLLPQIPYAEVPSIPEAYNIASSSENFKLFEAFFYDESSRALFGNEFVTFVQKNLRSKDSASDSINSKFKVKVNRLMPLGIKKLIRNKITGYQLDIGSLMLRSFIVYKMNSMMKEASCLISKSGNNYEEK